MLRLGIMLLFWGSTISVFAQTGFRLSGKLRMLNPTEIRVETINGEYKTGFVYPMDRDYATGGIPNEYRSFD